MMHPSVSQLVGLIIYLFYAAIGFNVKMMQYNNINFQVWDLIKDFRCPNYGDFISCTTFLLV